ncbi:hypothetical protein [Fictibacillus sp. NRS-1165]|uniref:hypothetical protein n=1 Tax=Fictibacillus sp. NRS-1165 TaxID=3144463 RepID=UPI003D219909
MFRRASINWMIGAGQNFVDRVTLGLSSFKLSIYIDDGVDAFHAQYLNQWSIMTLLFAFLYLLVFLFGVYRIYTQEMKTTESCSCSKNFSLIFQSAPSFAFRSLEDCSSLFLRKVANDPSQSFFSIWVPYFQG